MDPSYIIYPLISLAFWTFLVGMVMIALRVRTMQNKRISAETARHPPNMYEHYDRLTRSFGDNYINLHEQPTLFYALCVAIFALGHVDFTHLLMAWSYVTVRVAHTLIAISPARVESRAAIWGLGSIFLGSMLVRELWWMLGL